MSTNKITSSGCGCESNVVKAPNDLAVIPPGSIVVQTPCAENCTPQQSTPLTSAQGGGSDGTVISTACDRFRFSRVLSSFTAVGTSKTGQFNAECASVWAKPGQRIWFSGIDAWFEVIGASGDVVSYRNLSVDPGTEMLVGTTFMVEAPAQAFASDDDDGDGMDFSNTSTTMDAIYGENANSIVKMVPVNGQMLYACGGKWQRKQAGLMSYPISHNVLRSSLGGAFLPNVGSPASFVVALPSKPPESQLNCSLGFRIELIVTFWLEANAGNKLSEVRINNQRVAYGREEDSAMTNHCVVDLAKTDSSLTITINTLQGSGNSTYGVEVIARGYQY